MFNNNHTIIISAPIDRVWQALTTSEQITDYVQDMTVVSDWQEGSSITYTMHDENGAVLQWEGMDMVWSGTIKTLTPHEEFTVDYQPGAGVQSETYTLKPLDENSTEVTFDQTLMSEEIAQSYKEGNDEFLEMLKTFLENSK